MVCPILHGCSTDTFLFITIKVYGDSHWLDAMTNCSNRERGVEVLVVFGLEQGLAFCRVSM